ncbi:MAG: RDD family protein [Ornithinimicrobium sp.]|uniref:RDD family protein n=1 Tax=Ornithinimicrobium sp. TaxID=1977084 RepID=UPI003D9B370C
MATRGIFESEGFVTSEAVELDLPAASLPLRMTSGLLDLIVAILLGLLGLWLLSGIISGADAALLRALVILTVVLALVAVNVAQETLLRGRTVGKLALGLRTVRDDAGPIGFRHAVIRALVGFVEVWLSVGALALIVAATNERAKRLGDFLAGTYVVRDRHRLRLPPPPQTDPLLQEWAQGVDIATLPDGLSVALRQFLGRAGALTPTAREATGSRLYGDLLGYVAPPPPQGAPPIQVLATVLAERRRRDDLRLDREDALRAKVIGADPLH